MPGDPPPTVPDSLADAVEIAQLRAKFVRDSALFALILAGLAGLAWVWGNLGQEHLPAQHASLDHERKEAGIAGRAIEIPAIYKDPEESKRNPLNLARGTLSLQLSGEGVPVPPGTSGSKLVVTLRDASGREVLRDESRPVLKGGRLAVELETGGIGSGQSIQIDAKWTGPGAGSISSLTVQPVFRTHGRWHWPIIVLSGLLLTANYWLHLKQHPMPPPAPGEPAHPDPWRRLFCWFLEGLILVVSFGWLPLSIGLAFLVLVLISIIDYQSGGSVTAWLQGIREQSQLAAYLTEGIETKSAISLRSVEEFREFVRPFDRLAVAFGILVTPFTLVLERLFRRRFRREWLAWFALNVVLLVAFAVAFGVLLSGELGVAAWGFTLFLALPFGAGFIWGSLLIGVTALIRREIDQLAGPTQPGP
jgi:hypothetical protein